MLEAWVLGQSGTSAKDQGSHDLASEYGAQRTCVKAKVHWDWKVWNTTTTLYSSVLTPQAVVSQLVMFYGMVWRPDEGVN